MSAGRVAYCATLTSLLFYAPLCAALLADPRMVAK